MWLFDLNYNFELSDNKLSVNNLASKLVENTYLFEPITIEEILIFIIYCFI